MIVSPSAFRKAQDSLSDPKYFGKRVSRAQLLDDGNEESQVPSDSEVESDDRSEATKEDESSDTADPSPQQEPQPDVAQTVSRARQEDIEKGLAVSRQLVRHPLSSRIHLTL